MMRSLSFVAIVFCAALGGCATITRGTTSVVQFNSEPEGAKVETSRLESCMTPCSLTIGRKDEFQATFSKLGYKSQSVFVRTQIAGAGAAGLVGNALVGGIIGVGVDAVSGASLEHVPNPVSVVLEPVGSGTHRNKR